MPFGLHSAGATFQRLVDRIIGPELEPKVFAYLDDLIVISKTFEEHLDLLEEVFGRLRSANLKLNKEKCHFCRRELVYLGHLVNENGINTDPDKVRAVREFPRPNNVRGLRSFLGLASWYRKFVKDFAKISAPLTLLLRKNAKWNWDEAQETAFTTLKERLTNTPALTCPDFNEMFTVQVDASNDGLGAALTQTVQGKERVISYASRLLSDGEKRFTVTEKECLALVWAIRKFRPYLEGYRFTVITDHMALKWLRSLEKPSGRLGRWTLELQQHQFEVKYRKGALNKVADALSRHPVPQTPENCNPDERHGVCCVAEAEESSTPRTSTPKRVKRNWYERLYQRVERNLSKFPTYRIQGGKLYRKIEAKSHNADPTTQWKMCVPPDLRPAVLQEKHDDTTAGHFGVRKTIARVKERYYWPGLVSYVKKYVTGCPTCQAHKVEQRKAVGQMYFREPKGPWYMVTADLVGPLPRSKNGNRFLFVVQDTYSKWVELAPLKSATAKKVTDKFRDLILLRYGSPETVITDNGTQFVGKLWSKMLNEWEIRQMLTAPYSPQANPVERANRVLKTMIRQYVGSDQREWDVYLSDFRYGVNTAVHESTGFTPAMLNFGRELRVPKALHGPLLDQSNDANDPSTPTIHEAMMTRRRRIFEDCHKNLKKAFDRQSKYYNLRRRASSFKVGDIVLKRQHHLSSAKDHFAAQLAPKYDGPFKIIGMIGANVYSLVDAKGKPGGTVHAKDLKYYVAREL